MTRNGWITVALVVLVCAAVSVMTFQYYKQVDLRRQALILDLKEEVEEAHAVTREKMKVADSLQKQVSSLQIQIEASRSRLKSKPKPVTLPDYQEHVAHLEEHINIVETALKLQTDQTQLLREVLQLRDRQVENLTIALKVEEARSATAIKKAEKRDKRMRIVIGVGAAAAGLVVGYYGGSL